MRRCVLVLFVVLASTSVAAQSVSDLVGTWKLDRSRSEPKAPDTTGPELYLEISEAKQILSIKRIGVNTSVTTFFLDGSENKNVISQTDGTEHTWLSNARWQDDKLVIDGRRTLGDGRTALTNDALSLDPSKSVLTYERSADNGAAGIHSKEVFVRVESGTQ